MPRRRGHGHLQGRVPPPSLPGTPKAQDRLRGRAGVLVGSDRLGGSWYRQPPGRILQRDCWRPSAWLLPLPSRPSGFVPLSRCAGGGRGRERGLRVRDRPPLAAAFTNFFQPEITTAHAAVTVLEAAGHRVSIPRRILCGHGLSTTSACSTSPAASSGRSHGPEAGDRSRHPHRGPGAELRGRVRDELVNFFPDDGLARRLSRRTFTPRRIPGPRGSEPPRQRTAGRSSTATATTIP